MLVRKECLTLNDERSSHIVLTTVDVMKTSFIYAYITKNVCCEVYLIQLQTELCAEVCFFSLSVHMIY